MTQRHRRVCLLGVVCAVALALVPGWLAPAAAAGASVSIVDFAYGPASLSVSAGTTVVWTNTGNAPHSVTSDAVGQFDSSPNCPSPGPCLSPGQMFTHTFSAAGTFTYHCRVHPSMHGTVMVTTAAPPTTAVPAAAAPAAASATARTTSATGHSPPAAAVPGTPGSLAFTGAKPVLVWLAIGGVLFVVAGASLHRRGRARVRGETPREAPSTYPVVV